MTTTSERPVIAGTTPKMQIAREPVQCGECGCKSPLFTYFALDKQGVWRCPRCQARYQQSKQRRSLLTFWLAGLAWVVFMALMTDGRWSLEFLGINFMLFMLFMFLLVPLHELAHAAGAWLMRGTVFAIYVGRGPSMRERHIGRVTIAAQPLALVGSCVAGFRTVSHISGRTVVYIATPLLMHLLFILAMLPGLQINQIGTTIAWQEVFLLVNVMLLLENLTPRQIAAGPAQRNSDGMTLLRFARHQIKPEDLHMSYFWLDMLYSYRIGDYVRSVEAGKAGLALYPGQQYLRNGLATGLMALNDYAQALPLLHELINADEGVTEDVRALARNNLAFATLQLGATGTELDQALEDARLAYQMVSWMPEIRGTLGAVLVAEGQEVEGLEHLLAVFPDLEKDEAKANNLAYQALAKWQLGDIDSARDLLQRASQLDPSDDSAKRVEARFQSQEFAYAA